MNVRTVTIAGAWLAVVVAGCLGSPSGPGDDANDDNDPGADPPANNQTTGPGTQNPPPGTQPPGSTPDPAPPTGGTPPDSPPADSGSGGSPFPAYP